MPEAFQPVDHLVVSRAESLAKESLKTLRQLPETPSGPVEDGALVLLEAEVGAGVDVLVGGTAGADVDDDADEFGVDALGVVAGAEVGAGVDGADVGAGVDGEDVADGEEVADAVDVGADGAEAEEDADDVGCVGCVELGDDEGAGRW